MFRKRQRVFGRRRRWRQILGARWRGWGWSIALSLVTGSLEVWGAFLLLLTPGPPVKLMEAVLPISRAHFRCSTRSSPETPRQRTRLLPMDLELLRARVTI